MTPLPHTIARTGSLSAAGRLMRDNHLRHLPVLDGGRIVGVVWQRALFLVELPPGVNPTDVRVEETLVQDVFTLSPTTPVGEAIETMVDRKVGSAIVCESDRVLGVYTSIDALQALRALLERR
jgi:acetoin utilization protein AcuB